jgi:dTDP-4-amino-4,6-dideoxygalactose transaminase
VEKVLSGSRWFGGLQGDDPGTMGRLFGERFAEFHGGRFGMSVSNGSVAIELGLKALDVKPGDQVIVPAYTFISTATSVFMVGAVPVFADIDPKTYCMDPNDLGRCITPHTKAVMPVHLGGHMADMPAICDITEKNGLKVLEDAAQAIDSALQGKKAGTWGDLGTFSFQSNKTMTAGEGGLILTNDADVAEKVVALRAFGRFQDKPGVRSSDLTCTRVSTNYRLSELQAAVLLAQLERFPDHDKLRQANAEKLNQGVSQIPGLEHVGLDAHHNEPVNKHGYYYYFIRYAPDAFGGIGPDQLCKTLQAEGIPFVPGDRKPLYNHPVFEIERLADQLCPLALERYEEAMELLGSGCPATEAACTNTILLRHQVLLGNTQDMDDILEALWKVHNHIDELH